MPALANHGHQKDPRRRGLALKSLRTHLSAETYRTQHHAAHSRLDGVIEILSRAIRLLRRRYSLATPEMVCLSDPIIPSLALACAVGALAEWVLGEATVSCLPWVPLQGLASTLLGRALALWAERFPASAVARLEVDEGLLGEEIRITMSSRLQAM